MDIVKNGKLLCDLRKEKGMTQKQLAEKLGIVPKTVSKWETGHGFPDIGMLANLADILGVSERVLLDGSIVKNVKQVGNMRRTKFYVCPFCGSILQGVGKSQVICCGKTVEASEVKQVDDTHIINISEIENDYYVEINHDMTKEHFISFVAYVASDRILMIRLYPEQAPAVRFSKMHGGRFYFYCNKHGLFEYK